MLTRREVIGASAALAFMPVVATAKPERGAIVTGFRVQMSPQAGHTTDPNHALHIDALMERCVQMDMRNIEFMALPAIVNGRGPLTSQGIYVAWEGGAAQRPELHEFINDATIVDFTAAADSGRTIKRFAWAI